MSMLEQGKRGDVDDVVDMEASFCTKTPPFWHGSTREGSLGPASDPARFVVDSLGDEEKGANGRDRRDDWLVEIRRGRNRLQTRVPAAVAYEIQQYLGLKRSRSGKLKSPPARTAFRDLRNPYRYGSDLVENDAMCFMSRGRPALLYGYILYQVHSVRGRTSPGLLEDSSKTLGELLLDMAATAPSLRKLANHSLYLCSDHHKQA
nr:hypothetical protein CFP56_73510 [Quercus suber]